MTVDGSLYMKHILYNYQNKLFISLFLFSQTMKMGGVVATRKYKRL